ncbi:MAG: hypothetical protein EOO65_02260, partial [Methanosarcinales archaeon]
MQTWYAVAVYAAACLVAAGVGGESVITTVAGNGSSGYCGDGGAAQAARLSSPWGVTAVTNASSGGVVLYIADSGNDRIRHVDEGGNITTVAGTGTYGFSGDGGAATAAMLSSPWGVTAVTNASSGGVVLYIADYYNNRIRRVDEGGIITTVAGNGTQGCSGDGGPAMAARLYKPTCVTAVANASTGSVVLYIADFNNNRIRRVDEGGVITTVAGTGTAGFSGDHGPAQAARLSYPTGVTAVTNASSDGVVLYIADRHNHRIRRVDEGGMITTVAGNGTHGFSGDGGPAQAATLRSPNGVTVLTNTSSGGVVLYIADSDNHRIRRVDEGGIITTVAGTDTAGFSGDGGPAQAARLSNPRSVSVLTDTNSGGVVLYIADRDNHRIRRVAEAPSPSPSVTATASSSPTPSA